MSNIPAPAEKFPDDDPFGLLVWERERQQQAEKPPKRRVTRRKNAKVIDMAAWKAAHDRS